MKIELTVQALLAVICLVWVLVGGGERLQQAAVAAVLVSLFGHP